MSDPPVIPYEYLEYDGTGATLVRKPVIAETPWVLYLNGRELLTLMCTPTRLHCLVLGFLLSEGIISGLDDIWQMRVFTAEDRVWMLFPEAGLQQELTMRTCEAAVGSVDVRLRHAAPVRDERRILTSGCGGGVTFDDLAGPRPPLTSALHVDAATICALMSHMQDHATLYNQSRGVHTSGLYDPATGTQIALAEDVGRHNTIDKLRGECLLSQRATDDLVLLTSGRISTEMIGKAYKMGVPIVASRTSPTMTSVRLAQTWNITLIGYVRQRRLRVYTGSARIGMEPVETAGDQHNTTAGYDS
jgi:FdhD protein